MINRKSPIIIEKVSNGFLVRPYLTESEGMVREESLNVFNAFDDRAFAASDPPRENLVDFLYFHFIDIPTQ